MGVEFRIRGYFSIGYVRTAARFARQSGEVEAAHHGGFSEEEFAEHEGDVVGAVMFAVCFLEATINELFLDVADKVPPRMEQLGSTVSERMAALWALGVPKSAKYPILSKYQLALGLAHAPLFDRGCPPHQPVADVIALRNALMHYEPEWITALPPVQPGDDNEPKLARRLRGKFVSNPLAGDGDPFWPKKCLGHGCAKWAVDSSVAFADAFFERMELTPTYHHVRGSLSTDC